MCPFNERFARPTAERGYAARGPGERPFGVETLPGESASAETSEDPPDGELTKEDVSAETSGAPKLAHPGTESPSLVALMRLTREEWDAFIRGSAIRRAGYAGFNRNVAVAMGNWFASVEEPPDEAVAVLRGAVEEEERLVREHAAWALKRLRTG